MTQHMSYAKRSQQIAKKKSKMSNKPRAEHYRHMSCSTRRTSASSTNRPATDWHTIADNAGAETVVATLIRSG